MPTLRLGDKFNDEKSTMLFYVGALRPSAPAGAPAGAPRWRPPNSRDPVLIWGRLDVRALGRSAPTNTPRPRLCGLRPTRQSLFHPSNSQPIRCPPLFPA